MLLEIEKMGLKTKNIENFGYKRFLKEGNSYVIEVYGAEVGNRYLKESNLSQVKYLIPDFLEKIAGWQRPVGLDDLDKLLADGWLVGIDLDLQTLNARLGFSSHMVVIIKKLGQNYILHDPGLATKTSSKVL